MGQCNAKRSRVTEETRKAPSSWKVCTAKRTCTEPRARRRSCTTCDHPAKAERSSCPPQKASAACIRFCASSGVSS
eukprot:scaffold159588_cov26-Tisochrysis_lutea.AAC.6